MTDPGREDGDIVRIVWQTSRAELSARGRKGAEAQHARHDPRVTTRAGRRAFLDKFLTLADPDGVLPREERELRAAELRRAHCSAMGRRSAEVRRARRSTEKERSQ